MPANTRKGLSILNERLQLSGTAKGHYFYQDLLVAKRIYECAPRRHIDVGSRVDGFVTHVAVFREIEVVDIRPLDVAVANIKFIQMNAMADLDTKWFGICDSLSCLHAFEHFGLGRYGDPVAPDGYERGFANLVDILQPGGILYFSVPIGRQRVEFNALRVLHWRFCLVSLKSGRCVCMHFPMWTTWAICMRMSPLPRRS